MDKKVEMARLLENLNIWEKSIDKKSIDECLDWFGIPFIEIVIPILKIFLEENLQNHSSSAATPKETTKQEMRETLFP